MQTSACFFRPSSTRESFHGLEFRRIALPRSRRLHLVAYLLLLIRFIAGVFHVTTGVSNIASRSVLWHGGCLTRATADCRVMQHLS